MAVRIEKRKRASNEIDHFFSPLPSFSLRFIASDRCSFIDWPGSSFENRSREVTFARQPIFPHRVKNHRCGIQLFRDFSLYFSSFFLRTIYATFFIFWLFFFFFTLLYLGVIAREFRVNIRVIFQLGREQL